MRIIRDIKDFLSGFRETVAADREITTPSRLQWAPLVTLVVILSALIWILIAAI
jgi:hypothetical protein